MIHPLKMAYNDYIKEKYNTFVRGDKKLERTEIIAQKVSALGIDNVVFVELAVGLWRTWSKEQGHPYPYWNMVTSDKTFEWIEKLILEGIFQTVNYDCLEQQYMCESVFAMDYVSWFLGEQVDKPVRVAVVPDDIKISVAETLCRQYGVECVSSDYGYIAKQVAEIRDFK